jgi:hypothetical protein
MKNDGYESGIKDFLSFFDLLCQDHGPLNFFGEGLFKRLKFSVEKDMAIGAPYKHIFNGFSLLFFY